MIESKHRFTLKQYEKLIKLFQGHYKYLSYGEKQDNNKLNVYWRHDVDMSLNRALKLAQIENRYKISSTFFIQLSSLFYNLFDFKSIELIKSIINLGHKIGLHFFAGIYSTTSQIKLVEKLNFEKKILENIFDIKINVFSFHNPVKEVIESFKEEMYCGMINTYSEKFRSNYGYCSDSNGYWRFKDLETFFLENREQYSQVLTHPEWWLDYHTSPYKRVLRCVNGRKKYIMQRYENQFLKDKERKNIK